MARLPANPTPPTPGARPFLAAALSGVLLWASFFPLSLGFLAWVALVPWLTLVRAELTPRRRYLAAWAGGLLFCTAALQWIRVAHPAMYFAWIGLALYCSLSFPAALFLIRRIDRARVPLWMSVPVVWVSLEYFRAHFPTGFSWLEPLGLQHLIGFPWYFLGYTQHDYLPLIQIADIAGVYGVGFLVAAVNGLVFEVLLSVPQLAGLRRDLLGPTPVPSRGIITGAAFAVVLLAGTLVYGLERLNHGAFEEGPHVALLQSNVPQEVKMQRGLSVARTMEKICDEAVAPPEGEPRADLIVWPETSCPDDWYDPVPGVQLGEIPQRFQRERWALAAGLAGRWHANLLVGLNTIECDRNGGVLKFNSAVLIRPDGVPVNRYDKMHLVPFGEYVPARSLFPWLQVLTPYKGDYSCEPGRQRTRFNLAAGERAFRFGVLICYEDTDPSLGRRYADAEPAGGPVDFIVNISNDGWFRGSEQHEQHLAICRFRAIEARKPVLRSVNMGISAIIDGDGRVVKLPGETWGASKKVEAVLRGTVPLDGRESWYARLGDWLPLTCWGLLALGLVLPRFVRRPARVPVPPPA